MNRLVSLLSQLRGFLLRTRCKPLIAITAACLVLQEQYPLSDFPMYSSFGPTTYYLYLADGNGTPLASLTNFGMSTPTLKKVFSTEMRKERERLQLRPKRLTPEQKREVGERFLARLRESPAVRQRGATLPPVLRLYEVNIELTDRRFDKQTTMIAEVQ